MSFFIEKEVECNFNFDYEKVAETVVSASLEHESFPYEAEVNLTLTDNEGIHAINKEYRQIDRPTDVLSFPMLSYETPGDFSFLSDENEDDFNPDTGEVMLGDIIISVDKVKEQAIEYGHSEKSPKSSLPWTLDMIPALSAALSWANAARPQNSCLICPTISESRSRKYLHLINLQNPYREENKDERCRGQRFKPDK